MILDSVLQADPEATSKSSLVSDLDRRVEQVEEEFQSSPLGQLLADPTSSTKLIGATIREIYWEIHCYQPSTTKAGFSMIGGITPEERKVMRSLLMHKWEEVEHRIWALDGYKALGGDQSRIGRASEFMSPGAFAVAAVWERLATRINPLAYLGAEYLFEDLTARLTKSAIQSLATRGFSQQGLRFISDHAIEDEKHSRLLKHLIVEVSERHPEVKKDTLFAFDCFRHVYPMPLWLESYARAKTDLNSQGLLE